MKKVCAVIALAAVSLSMFWVLVPGSWATDEPIQAYINRDGSVSPSYAPISTHDNVTYTLNGNISYPTFWGLIINRSNIIVDGNGNTVQGNDSSNNGISLTDVTNVTIRNFDIKDFNYGIILDSANYTIIANNTATANQAGFYSPTYPPMVSTAAIFLIYSSFDTVNGNNITGIDLGYAGIALDYSSNNTIQQNNVYSNNASGIGLAADSYYNSIIENNLSKNYDGIELDPSSYNNTVIGNNATSNFRGITLDGSFGNELRSNEMVNNIFNFGVNSVSNIYDPIDFVNDVDSSNTVDGKPIYYWVNRNNTNLPVDAGCAILVNCSSITVQETNPTGNWQGILLAYTTNSTVTQNNLTDDWEAIVLYGSQNDSVVLNRLVNSYQGGIFEEQSSNIWINGNAGEDWEQISLESSTNSTIRSNNVGLIQLNFNSNDTTLIGNTARIDIISSSFDNITGNNATGGIYLSGSYNCTITGNLLENNQIGLQLSYAANNTVYHNDFINNSVQVSIDSTSSNNTWNQPYPSGGNYWSNYTGKDVFSGPYQNITGSDGIGDTPYVINSNNTDYYPLMKPVTTVPELTEPLILAIFMSATILAIAIKKKRRSRS